MATPVLMPQVGQDLTEGKIVALRVKVGDIVAKGDIVAEVESEKATFEVEAFDAGVVIDVLYKVGDTAEVLKPLLFLGQPGNGAERSNDSKALAGPPAVAPVLDRSNVVEVDAAPCGAVRSSPLARRLAKENGLDIGRVTGSGPRGSVVKRDIEAAIAGNRASPQAPPAAIPSDAWRDEPLSSTRRVIARRLSESKRTVPHFYLTIDCELRRMLDLRVEINRQRDRDKFSVNDFIVRAVAMALAKVPAVNAAFVETAIRYFDDVDVAVAVATPAGLITPVIRQADRKSMGSISQELRELAGRAREGRLKPEEYQGGGFTVSNLGMYGVREFAAIINPPQACILAVGAAEQRVVVRDGAPTVATLMTNTLSVDHRVVDGAVGAEFLAAYKKLIEDPLTLLL